MRGTTPLKQIARKTRLDVSCLQSLETGRVLPDTALARRVLRRAFDVDQENAARLVLGLQLYDLGLRDNELRQLVIALIRKAIPERDQEEIRGIYRRHLTRSEPRPLG